MIPPPSFSLAGDSGGTAAGGRLQEGEHQHGGDGVGAPPGVPLLLLPSDDHPPCGEALNKKVPAAANPQHSVDPKGLTLSFTLKTIVCEIGGPFPCRSQMCQARQEEWGRWGSLRHVPYNWISHEFPVKVPSYFWLMPLLISSDSYDPRTVQ